MRREKGFTLVELLIVLAIIAALSTVLVPNIPRWTNSAKAGVIESDISQIANAMIQYVNSEGGSIPADVNKAISFNHSALSEFFSKQPTNPFGDPILVKTSDDSGTILTASASPNTDYGYILYTGLPSYVSDKIKHDLGSSSITVGNIKITTSSPATIVGISNSGPAKSSILYRIQLNK